jgi:hypothetical protein
MHKIFPHPKKIKSFTRNKFKDNPQESIKEDNDLYSSAFRGEFENCGREIEGDIYAYWERKRKRKRKKV